MPRSVDAGARRRPALDLDLHIRVRVVAVRLGEELPDQLAGGERLDLVDDEAALAAHPAAAHVEDLDRGLELVLGDADDVGVGAVGEHDGLLLRGPGERPDVVAQPGRALVVLRLRGVGHLPLEALDEARRTARP